jgi:hypothetical protein
VIAIGIDGRFMSRAAVLKRDCIQRSSREFDEGRSETCPTFMKQEACGVPDFVGEGAGAFQAVRAEDDVGAGRGAGQQRHAHGVGAVLLGHDQRVDHVALGLRHLLLFGIAHEAVDVDLAERHVAHELDAEHRHARDPEEENVEAGDQQRVG